MGKMLQWLCECALLRNYVDGMAAHDLPYRQLMGRAEKGDIPITLVCPC